eukprot:TRINITY_DN17375_c0_g1_i2.p1 TRINITY_DN17375_c0_g1~~TRINITY_DN17375_c0_g1_i2.p1  ORF type:complete len:308 (-),score=27.49 TRINITY_DN17375_c0_g1_i2:56-979(-)
MARRICVLYLATVAVAQRIDGLNYRRMLFDQMTQGQNRAHATQRWVGAQSPDDIAVDSSTCSFKVPLDSDIVAMPHPSLAQVHYIYCDLHHTWPNGFFTQFVPQLEKGHSVCFTDEDYNLHTCDHPDDWFIQAQYIWSESHGSSTAASVVKGWVGERIKVQPGDDIFTNISYGACGGIMGWNMEISANGDAPSAICVATPFMGRVPAHSQPYSSGGTSDYWHFSLGDLHEAWFMDTPGYYPTSQTFTNRYSGKDGSSLSTRLIVHNSCFDHSTGKRCPSNVMTAQITAITQKQCDFTIKRGGGSIVV